MADIGNIAGWSEPDTLYPPILSVGVVIALVVWDVWSVWFRTRDDTRGIVSEDA